MPRKRRAGWTLGVALALCSVAMSGSRQAAIVVDADTGDVLHELQADAPRAPASLAKMMTLYLVLEALRDGKLTLAQRLPVSRHAARAPALRLGLRPGTTLGVEEAILATTVHSANDVAVVLAEALAGSEAAFARRMTLRARALGMTRTTFANASGLPHPRQRSTARDLATLARALVAEFPERYAYFSAREFRHAGRVFRTHNRWLLAYPGADGLKTGYVRASGYSLAASARRDGRRLIAVVLGGRTPASRDRQVATLLDEAFDHLPLRAPEPLVADEPAEPALQPVSETALAPVAAPGPEPVAEPALEPEPVPVFMPVPEPALEPIPEPGLPYVAE